MISGIKTAVILVLIIDFIQLLGGGKEYGHFVKLVTGLLVACSLCGGILQVTGSITEDTWLLWLTGQGNGLEDVLEEASESVREGTVESELESVREAVAEGEPESVREGNVGRADMEYINVEDVDPQGKTGENEEVEERNILSAEMMEIEVPSVENIPRIEIIEIQIEYESGE